MIDVSASGHYTGDCRDLLAQLPPRFRNHASIPPAVGVFTALRPDEATRIGGP